MKVRKLLFVIVCSLMGIICATAQSSTLKGVIKGDGELLIGVGVKVKEFPNIVAITDIEGRFTLQVPEGGKKLTISYLGFLSKEVEIGSQTEFAIQLEPADKSLEEVVVVGYGSMKKRDLTGAIATLSSDAVASRSAANAFDAIQGQMSGIQVVNSSGSPGATPDIRVRGTSTFGEGYKPLYVVDGAIQEDISNLNPSDIQSMEVLKDAASAAIYGSRSGNGVIIITTKSGMAGAPKLEVKYLHSYGKLGRILPHSNLQQRVKYDLTRKLMGESNYTFPDTLSAYGNSDVDLFGEMFRISQRDQIDFNMSGATDKANYFIGTGFYNEKGIVVNSGYQRLTWRMNADYKFTPKVTFGTRQSMTYSNRYGLNESSSNIFSEILFRPAYYPVYNPDGTFVGAVLNHANPVAIAVDGINLNQQYLLSNLNFMEIKILPGLTFKTNLQGNFSLSKSQYRIPQNQIGTTGLYSGTDNSVLNYNYANENYFNYSLKRTNHNLTALLGASAQAWSTYTNNMKGLDYASDNIYTMNGVSGFDVRNTNSMISRHTMQSVFSRISYAYKDRYMLSTNIREDGSSRFGANTKWGLFPSVSLGWRISEETFMKFSEKVLSDAKFRASWGVTGNESIGNYDAKTLYSAGNIYNGINGIAPSTLSNLNLSWEQTEQMNGGLDLSLFEGRARISVDAYIKNTTNLLYKVPLPTEIGFVEMRQNVGAMQSKGIEFNCDASLIKTKAWKWTAGFNVTNNNSIIVNLADGVPFYPIVTDNAIYVHENCRVGEIYGYKFQGVFAYDQSNAFTEDYKQQLTPVFVNGIFQNSYLLNGQVYTGVVKQKYDSDGSTVLKGGDINFQDLDGNGIITDKDKMVLGCSQPIISGGFNSSLSYKSIAITASFIYSIGGSVYNSSEAKREQGVGQLYTPSPIFIDNMWTKQGDVTNYHAPTSNTMNNRSVPSSFYVEDASFVRLKSLRCSYTFTKALAKRMFLKELSVYVYGNNLLTFTRFSGFDPEIPSTGGALTMGVYSYNYPQKKEIGFGCNVNF